jgi:membrane protease subunit HflC
MKSLPSIIAAIVLVVVLLTYMCTFQVRSTEVAIIKTFGQADQEPIEVDDESDAFFGGMHLKWPWPIQSVEKYDKRLRILEDRIEETPTLDSKQIILTTFAAWTISDPYKFHTRYQTIEAGEDALRSRIRGVKKAIIGSHDFSDFVSTRSDERKLREIEVEMERAIADEARDEFGISIKLFGIKQLSLPQSVTEAVFETMKTAQEIKAKTYRSEGDAEASRIVAGAEATVQRIGAVVSRKVAEIESEGLAEVGAIYAQFTEHEELRIFLDQLRALENILQRRTELFLDTTMQPVNLFDESTRMMAPKTPVASGSEAPSEPQPE